MVPERDRALERVAQLADVPRPGVAGEPLSETAPENAPRRWPKSSLSASSRGTAPPSKTERRKIKPPVIASWVSRE